MKAFLMKESGFIAEGEPDGKLLARARQGDEESFVTLFRRHRNWIFRFALYMCGRREWAEEVTQEVFLALLAEGAKYREDAGEFQPFLLGVTRNQVRKHLRQTRPVPGKDYLQQMVSIPQVYEQVQTEQDVAALRAAVLKLPPKYREAVVLCELEGMDLSRASKQLNCPIGTLKSRLHRARSLLRAKLQDRERCPA